MPASKDDRRQPNQILGRVGISIFFAIFAAFGLFFLVLAGRSMLGTLETYTWKEAPAEILSAEVVEDPDRENPYVAQARFRYSWEGVDYESGQFALGTERHAEYGAARAKLEGLFPGVRTTCFVNPKDPSQAVLRHGSWWILLFLLIPVAFVLVGVGGIYGTWARRDGPGIRSQPGGGRKSGGIARRIVGGVFVAIGVAVLVLWYLPALLQSLASFQWVETPCTVVSSRVVEVDSDDGSTYRIDILYRYVVGGEAYQSSRYKVFQGTSSGRAGKQAVVDRYPPGKETVCYVDPASPGKAVLVRGVGWEAAFGLVPVMFIGFGLVAFFHRASASGSVVLAAERRLAESGVPRALKSRATPWARMGVALFIATFWNGIVAVFLVHLVEEWQSGRQPWFLTVFLVPFVLVGLGLLAAAGYALLSLTNPRVRVSVSPDVWVGGEEIEVAWSLSGATNRLTRLRIYIEGREEATYRRGTSSITDRHVFARLGVADLTNTLEIAQGQARRRLPLALPPGFSAGNNKILWSLKVRGSIPFWPDLDEEFELVIAAGGPR